MSTNALALLEVDPRTLQVIDQVRSDATPDDALIASVRERGIIEPPTVARNDAGELVIVTGHRRVGAAIVVGLATISVVERLDGDAAERLADQVVENERRAQLPGTDVAAAYQQLELFGLTPDDIAAALGDTPDRIRAGLRVSKSKTASKVIANHPTINLEQAAILAEFDGHKKHQDDLTTVAAEYPQNFAYRVERARTEIALQTKIADETKKLKDRGIKVIKDPGYMGDLRNTRAQLEQLTTAEGEKLTVTAHKKCPGHIAWISGTWSLDTVKVQYGCADWEKHGHVHSYKRGTTKTDEELRAEHDRAEREALLEANRVVRRQWIHDLLPGKINQLAGVYEYMAAALLVDDEYYAADRRAPLVMLPLLDVDVDENERHASQALDELLASKRVAPFRLMLATAFAIHEKRCARAHPGDAPAIIRHFEQLERWGYTLSDIDTGARDASLATIAEQAERDAARAAAAAEAAAADQNDEEAK